MKEEIIFSTTVVPLEPKASVLPISYEDPFLQLFSLLACLPTTIMKLASNRSWLIGHIQWRRNNGLYCWLVTFNLHLYEGLVWLKIEIDESLLRKSIFKFEVLYSSLHWYIFSQCWFFPTHMKDLVKVKLFLSKLYWHNEWRKDWQNQSVCGLIELWGSWSHSTFVPPFF